MVKADLTPDDISVLKRWGGNMRKAKNGVRPDLGPNGCAYCRSYRRKEAVIGSCDDSVITLCSSDCPIYAYTLQPVCVGTPHEQIVIMFNAEPLHGRGWPEGLRYEWVRKMFNFIVAALQDRERRLRENRHENHNTDTACQNTLFLLLG